VGIGQDITAHLEQEKEYSKLIDNAYAPIFGVNTQRRINVWNKCSWKIVGYTLEEVMGWNLVEEFITKEYKYAVSTVLGKALKGEETANFEFPLITKHGVQIEVLLNAMTRQDEQGNIIGVVGIGQDIIGRMAQKREYSKLIDLVNAPIFGVITQGCVNVWNICTRNLVSHSTEEVMGHLLVQKFITQDYQAAVQADLDRALAGVETANFEIPLIKKAEARIEVLVNATIRQDEHRKVTRVVGIGQDSTGCITQEREYAKLIDTANAPIFGANQVGII
jgi:PAS domain S-box-containing protein